MATLPHAYYTRSTVDVARDLLGCVLVRTLNGQRLAGRIVETEAYVGPEDLACHARAGRTARNAVMFGPGGHAYVYLIYGIYWMLNAVTEHEGQGSAVLIRAIEPQEGLETMAANRKGRPPRQWTSGPAKLAQALQIDGAFNGADLTGSELFIEQGVQGAGAAIQTGPRIGLDNAPEPWRSMPWRFWIGDNPYVSKSP